MVRIIASFSILPVGTGDTSLSKYVAEGLKELDKKEIEYKLTPMCTIIEGDSLKEVFNIIRRVEQAVMEKGVDRVITKIEIDDRVDKLARKSDEKVESVKKKLG